MTTSQASRVYGIPYNSLLMYVRGKYGKSLKLDKLKETTPAAKDNLNTIGNSRSTPKEKMATTNENQNKQLKTKHGSGSSSGSNKSANSGPKTPILENFENNPFMAAMSGITGLGPLTGTTADSSRVKEVMQQMQTRQALLDHSERLKEFEKHMGSEQAKLLMPFFTGNTNLQNNQQLTSQLTNQQTAEEPNTKENNKDQENLTDKERQVQEILIEATRKNSTSEEIEKDDNKNNVNTSEIMKPLEVNTNPGEISAS